MVENSFFFINDYIGQIFILWLLLTLDETKKKRNNSEKHFN